jgi:origin recognition complex subunit 5
MAFFSSTSSSHPSPLTNPNPYHPVFMPLYRHFAGTLYDVCSLYAFGEPEEFAYVASARWPGFVQPLLDRHAQSVQEAEEEADFLSPSEEDRMFLITTFKSSFGRAFEVLYPRLQHAGQWARAERLAALDEVAQEVEEEVNNSRQVDDDEATGLDLLSRTARFVLLAAFLASTNPSKSDLRMFGRGLDEKKRRRRKAASGLGIGGKKGGMAKVGAPRTFRVSSSVGVYLTLDNH